MDRFEQEKMITRQFAKNTCLINHIPEHIKNCEWCLRNNYVSF